MARVADLLPRAQRLALAVRAHSPARLARVFADHSGGCDDRAAFDGLARETAALYATGDPRQAAEFRQRLDARLARRERDPVTWSPPTADAPPA